MWTRSRWILTVSSVLLLWIPCLAKRHAHRSVDERGITALLSGVRSTLGGVERAIVEKEAKLRALRLTHERSGSQSMILLDTFDSLERDLEDLRQLHRSSSDRVEEMNRLLHAGSLQMGRNQSTDSDMEHRSEKESFWEAPLDRANEEDPGDVKRRLLDLQRREAYEAQEREMLATQLMQLKESLHSLEDVVDDPTLSRWLVKHAEGVGRLFASKEAGLLVGERVTILTTAGEHAIEGIEKSLEKELDSILTHRYSPTLATILAYLIVGVPFMFVFLCGRHVMSKLATRQMIFLIHLFNLGLVLACLFASILLRGGDPLHALNQHARKHLVLLHVVLGCEFPVLVGMLCFAVLKIAPSSRSKMDIAAQLIGYILLALDYRRAVWRPVLSGLEFEAQNLTIFLLYLIIIMAMICLTISSAMIEKPDLIISLVGKEPFHTGRTVPSAMSTLRWFCGRSELQGKGE